MSRQLPQDLSDRLPSGVSPHYSAAARSALRIDKGVPCGKGWIAEGKECRVGRGTRAAAPRRLAQRSPEPKPQAAPNHVKLAALLTGVAVAGGAVGAFAAAWMTQQGAKQELGAAQKAAADRLKVETDALKKEAQAQADKLRQQAKEAQAAQAEAEAAAARAQQEAGDRVGAESSRVQAEAKAQAAKAQAEADRKLQAEVERIEREANERAAKLQAEADERIKAEAEKSQAEAQGAIAKAQAEAEARLRGETERVEREANERAAQIQREADERIKAEADRLAQEANGRVEKASGEAEARQRQGVDEAKRTAQAAAQQEVATATAKIQSEADRRIAEVQTEADRRIEESIAQLTSETEERISQIQAEADARLRSEADRIQQEALSQSEQRVQAKGAELDQSMRQELQAKQQELQQEFDRKVVEAQERIQSEAIAQITRERESALKAAQEEIAAAAQPKARRSGELVDDDAEGIALAASVRQGLDLNTVSEANMQRRFNEATKRMAARRLQQGLTDLALGFRDRTKEIQSMGSDRTPGTGKALQRQQQSRWEAMERALINQARRESALTDEVDEARKVAAQEYSELLSELQASARDRGGYESDLLAGFDKKSRRINQRMQKRISQFMKEVDEAIRLDRSNAYYQELDDVLRGDAWRTIKVAASPKREAHTRRIWSNSVAGVRRTGQKVRREVNRVVQTGQAREVDVKPLIEETLTAIASNVVPDWMGSIAAGVARATLRTWRMSYEDARLEGLDGVFNKLKTMTPEEREEILSEGLVEFTTTAFGEAVEREVSSTLPDVVEGVRSRRQRKGDAGMASQFHYQVKQAIEHVLGQTVERLAIQAIQGNEVTGVFSTTANHNAQAFRLASENGEMVVQVGASAP